MDEEKPDSKPLTEPEDDPAAGAGSSEPVGETDEELQRREFLSKAVSIGLGGVIVAVPAGAGLATLLSPLAGGKQGGLKVRLASVSDLPEDGTPKRFNVVTERVDAWTKHRKKAIGSVWLRKMQDGSVAAFNSSCPHLGCSVDFDSAGGSFSCPCHASRFTLDGERVGESVSPRGMDSLEIDPEELPAGEIWVTFQNFKPVIADKVPV